MFYLAMSRTTLLSLANISGYLCIGQCLSRALRNENPKFLMAASALVLPFQPLMVSAVHTGMMEVLIKAHETLTLLDVI